jgi:hypothetical protein
MASSTDHSLSELANRLVDFADGIENPADYEAEQDIRRAADILRDVENPTPLIPRLVKELTKVATFSADLETRRTLRALLGGA